MDNCFVSALPPSDRTAEFVRLFSSCSQRLYRTIRAALPQQEYADEVYQETSITLWEKFAEFEPGTNFAAWATTIARYKILQFQHRKVRDRRVFSAPLINEIMSQSDQLDEALERRRGYLADCLQKLNDHDRDLLRRRFGLGQTSNQVAASLRRSPSFVSKALSRIHRALLHCIRLQESEEAAY